jgi:hypothetical protein
MFALVFVGRYLLPPIGEVILGMVALFAASIYSVRTLGALVPLGKLPRPAQKLLRWLGVTPQGAHPGGS